MSLSPGLSALNAGTTIYPVPYGGRDRPCVAVWCEGVVFVRFCIVVERSLLLSSDELLGAVNGHKVRRFGCWCKTVDQSSLPAASRGLNSDCVRTMKFATNAAISSAAVSSAKWPPSTTWTSAFGTSLR